MKTLVACTAAALLGSAALVFAAAVPVAAAEPTDPGPTTAALEPAPTPAQSAPAPTEPVIAVPTVPPPAPPAPPLDPIVTITCTQIDVQAQNPPDSGRQFAWAQGRAEKGTPSFLPLMGPLGERLYFSLMLDPGQATAWIFQIRAADGSVLWSRSGTTAPCAPEPTFKYTAPFHPVQPVAACGKTLADVTFPSTPGIVYSHDEWNAYARLQPGWSWDYDAFGAPYSWWVKDSRTSDTAWLPRSAFLMDAAGCAPYAAVMPPLSTMDGPALATGATLPAPSPTTVPTGAGTSAPPATVGAEKPTAPPAPTASPTTPAQARSARLAAGTGLGLAGGLTGASVLAVAGAFVVRRLRHVPGDVMLDERPTD